MMNTKTRCLFLVLLHALTSGLTAQAGCCSPPLTTFLHPMDVTSPLKQSLIQLFRPLKATRAEVSPQQSFFVQYTVLVVGMAIGLFVGSVTTVIIFYSTKEQHPTALDSTTVDRELNNLADIVEETLQNTRAVTSRRRMQEILYSLSGIIPAASIRYPLRNLSGLFKDPVAPPAEATTQALDELIAIVKTELKEYYRS